LAAGLHLDPLGEHNGSPDLLAMAGGWVGIKELRGKQEGRGKREGRVGEKIRGSCASIEVFKSRRL